MEALRPPLEGQIPLVTQSEQAVSARGTYLGVSESKSVTCEDWFCLHCDIKGIFHSLASGDFLLLKVLMGTFNCLQVLGVFPPPNAVTMEFLF